MASHSQVITFFIYSYKFFYLVLMFSGHTILFYIMCSSVNVYNCILYIQDDFMLFDEIVSQVMVCTSCNGSQLVPTKYFVIKHKRPCIFCNYFVGFVSEIV